MATMILCCLGNPGERYRGTRHNLGFLLADRLVDERHGRWSQPHPSFLSARVRVGGDHVEVIKPLTYMNCSGDALDARDAAAPVDPARVLVVCDDIALPLGMLRLRTRGSDGGHNGLKSITASLGTQDFARLRIGVGPVPERVDPADFVLAPMGSEDAEEAALAVARGVLCVETVLVEGYERAMSRFNARVERGEESD